METDKKLAIIVKVLNIDKIENADNIELVSVLGWNVVVKKRDFAVDDLAIYFCIDSVPDKNNEDTKFLNGKHLKTKKIRGVISQGLLMPISLLNNLVDISLIKEDDDVTEILNVKKYILPEEQSLYNYKSKTDSIPTFPTYVPKTDEPRIQASKKKIKNLVDVDVIITIKMDGTSTTYIHNKGEVIVCGRNYIIEKDVNSTTHVHQYYYIFEKHNLSEKLKKLGRNIAIQGELCGPKINSNRVKLTEIDYFVFNIYDIDNNKYLNYKDMLQITEILEIKTVPLVYHGKLNTIDQKALLDLADKQEYSKGVPAEGIVVKTDGDGVNRISFKVISNEYLIKYNI